MTSRRLLTIAALGALGFGAGLFVLHASRLVMAPYELGYGEGILFWQIGHVTRLAEAYHDVSAYPFVVFHYPPAYHLAVRATELLGPGVRVAGRLVSLVSALGALAAIGYVAYQAVPARAGAGVRWFGGAAAALLGANLDTLFEWVPQARVDMLGLCLTLAGLALFVTAEERPRSRDAAFICFVLAVFTKQTFLAAPLACWIAAWARGPKEAVRLGLIATVAGGLILGLLEVATAGQFLIHTLGHNQNAFSIGRLSAMLTDNLRGTAALVAIAAIPALSQRPTIGRSVASALERAGAAFRRTDGGARLPILQLYAGVALLISATAGKSGSAPNYFIEWNLAACALAGVTLASLGANWPTRASWPTRSGAWQAAGLILVMAFAVPAAARHVNGTLHLTDGSRRLETARRSEYAAATEFVRTTPGPIFSYDMSLLVLSGKDVPLEPAIMWDLARSGAWDPAPFVRQISQGFYHAIIATGDLDEDRAMPGSVRAAITASYRPVMAIGSYRIYEPAVPQTSAGMEPDARRH